MTDPILLMSFIGRHRVGRKSHNNNASKVCHSYIDKIAHTISPATVIPPNVQYSLDNITNMNLLIGIVAKFGTLLLRCGNSEGINQKLELST